MDIEDATDEIIKFSDLIKNAQDEKSYWFHYLITAKVILEGKLVSNGKRGFRTVKWEMPIEQGAQAPVEPENGETTHTPILNENGDENYDELLGKDEEFKELLKKLKNFALLQIRSQMLLKNKLYDTDNQLITKIKKNKNRNQNLLRKLFSRKDVKKDEKNKNSKNKNKKSGFREKQFTIA